jgi:hypothetical protein
MGPWITLDVADGIAVVTMARAPVNAMSRVFIVSYKGVPAKTLLGLRGVEWVTSGTCGYDGTVRSPAACR